MGLFRRWQEWRGQKRKLEAQRSAEKYSPEPVSLSAGNSQMPDRTPEEVDARTRSSRRRRMETFAPSENAYPAKRDEGKIWLPKQDWVASIDNPGIAQFGTWARFEYVDGDGVVTDRHIRQWSKRGAYIEGFCMKRRESRLFRQDRINNWRCG